jgi:hypothetical protein
LQISKGVLGSVVGLVGLSEVLDVDSWVSSTLCEKEIGTSGVNEEQLDSELSDDD